MSSDKYECNRCERQFEEEECPECGLIPEEECDCEDTELVPVRGENGSKLYIEVCQDCGAETSGSTSS